MLCRSQLKESFNVAVPNTMNSTDGRMISALRSRTDGSRLGRIGTAVSIAVGTEIGDQVSQGVMFEMVKDAAVEMVAQPKVMSMIAGGLTKSDKLTSPIAKFVVTPVKKKARNLDYVKKEPKMDSSTPSSPSADSFKETRKSTLHRQARKSRRRREST